MKTRHILSLTAVLLSTPIRADVITDGSLGSAGALTGPDFQITADLGQQRGGNLFHSFSQFNIASDESATFSGPAEVTNILSRVTGGNGSTIDGLLRSEINGANLFLLNPAGVMFGPNASLDLSGSLHVSSADYLALDDLTRFMATPQVGEVLSTAAPTAFGFLDAGAGAIQVQGSQLTLNSGNTLTLAANGIELDNAALTIDQGSVQLSSLASAGEVLIATGEANGMADYGDITIAGRTDINVDGAGGGRMLIRGRQLTLADSELSARTEGALTGQGVDIAVDGFDFIRGRIDTGTAGSGDAGDITIQANQMLFEVTDVEQQGLFSGFPVMTVTLDISHTYDEDLTAKLSNPDGTEVVLFSALGGSDDNFSQTTFNDNAAQPISNGTAPFSGSYQAEQPLFTFHGENTQGAWILRIEDSFPEEDGGSLNQWSLNFNGATVASVDVPVTIPTNNGTPNPIVIQSQLDVVDSFAGRGGTIRITADSLTLAGDPQSPVTESLLGGAFAMTVGSIQRGGKPFHFMDDGRGNGSFIPVTIIVDGSLTPAQPLLPDGNTYRISDNLGQIQGNNLFHSFTDFGLLEGFSAVYSGPTTIEHIISRVTGGNQSVIEGALSSDIVGADLFLLNPAGVMFGANASLNVSGSLHVSSADYLVLENSNSFMAIPQGGEVLSPAAPSAFGFLGTGAGAIQLQGAALTLNSGNTLTLAANGIAMDGAASLSAEQGSVQLVSVSSAGEVAIGTGETNGVLNEGTITVTGGSKIAVSGNGGGRITLRGDDILLQNSTVELATQGGILVQARAVDISDSGKISSTTSGDGPAGGITIDASDIELLNGGTITTDTSAGGDAGPVAIKTARLLIDSQTTDNAPLTGIVSTAQEGSTGSAGDISIQAQAVELRNVNSEINSGTKGEGDAGDITIKATDIKLLNAGRVASSTESAGNAGFISVQGDRLLVYGTADGNFGTGVFSNAQGGSTGNGGSIAVQAQTVELVNTGQITALTLGDGDAGAISIRAGHFLIDSNNTDKLTGIVAESQSTGNAGNISVQAQTMELRNILGEINSSTRGDGRAGEILIEANDLQLLSAGRIDSSTYGAGDAGEISVRGQRLLIDGVTEQEFGTGLFSNAQAGSTGNGGSISVQVQNVALTNSGQITALTQGGGNGGFIDIQATAIELLNGGAIDSTAQVAGDAGNIDLTASDHIRLFNGGRLSTASVGGGGRITVMVDELLHLKDSVITTSVAQGAGNGGDILVDPIFIVLDNSEIIANAVAGNGGNITLIADYIIRSIDSRVSASSQLGIDGNIDIQALDVDVETGEDNLSADFLNAERWAQQACSRRDGNIVSSFILGRPEPRPAPFDDWSGSPMGF